MGADDRPEKRVAGLSAIAGNPATALGPAPISLPALRARIARHHDMRSRRAELSAAWSSIPGHRSSAESPEAPTHLRPSGIVLHLVVGLDRVVAVAAIPTNRASEGRPSGAAFPTRHLIRARC
jgi:hypothetical protein